MKGVCAACKGRPAAQGADFCLACLATGHGADPKLTVNQSDPHVTCDLLRTGQHGPLVCVRCGARVRIVNLFGGAGYYLCQACGLQSQEAREAEPWPAQHLDALGRTRRE